MAPLVIAGVGLAGLAGLVRAGLEARRRRAHQADSAASAPSVAAAREPGPNGDERGLAFDRVGQGDPIVLLHGHGLSRRSWDPVCCAAGGRA